MLQFNLAQIDRLSEMLSNFSLVMLAAFVLPVFNQPQGLQPLVILSGGAVSLITSVLSLAILKGNIK